MTAKRALDPALCNCTAVRRASRHLTRFYDACIASSGLKATQYTILRALSVQGQLTINELADILVMDRTTIGHNVKPLERDGLIDIGRSEHDLRVKVVILTGKGEKLVEKTYLKWKEAQAQFEKAFGEEQASQMRALMRMVTSTELIQET